MGMLKLNLGSGASIIDGFQNVDRKTGREVFPLDFQTGSADEIRASHILEHFPEGQIQAVLKEWYRVLKLGGVLRVAVPNLKEAYALQTRDPLWAHYIMGGHVDENDVHHSVWTKAKLVGALIEAGFYVDLGVQQQPWKSEVMDCASLPVSLNVRAIKPLDGPMGHTEKAEATAPGTKSIQLKMVAMVSLPRFGINDFWGCVMDAFKPWNIPVIRYTGAWWHRGIAEGFQKAIDTGVDVVIVLDYDTFFSRSHVEKLLYHLASNPQADAVFPVQVRRNHGTPLCWTLGATPGTPVTIQTNEATECESGHFGLTFIKVDAIKRIPKPWFMDTANEEGKYEVDPDIYFWKKFRKAGGRAFMLPWVHVGHGEFVVSELDPVTWQHRFTRCKDWFTRESPEAGHSLDLPNTTAEQKGAENADAQG